MKKRKLELYITGKLMSALMVGKPAIFSTGGEMYHTAPVVKIHETEAQEIHFETYSNSPRQLQTWTAHRVHVIQNVYHTNILLFFFYSNLFSFFWASRLKQAPRRIRRPSVAFTMNNCLCHFMGKMLCKGFF